MNHPLTDSQLSRFWGELTRTKSRGRTALAVIASTGARPSEVLWARWSDWDGRGQLLLHTSKRRDNNVRSTRLNSVAITLLKELRNRSPDLYESAPMSLIFASQNSNFPITDRSLRSTAAAVGRRIGRPSMNPYTLRHTYGTLVTAELGQGVAQDLMGHLSPSSTARYVHARPSDAQRAAEVMSQCPE